MRGGIINVLIILGKTISIVFSIIVVLAGIFGPQIINSYERRYHPPIIITSYLNPSTKDIFITFTNQELNDRHLESVNIYVNVSPVITVDECQFYYEHKLKYNSCIQLRIEDNRINVPEIKEVKHGDVLNLHLKAVISGIKDPILDACATARDIAKQCIKEQIQNRGRIRQIGRKIHSSLLFTSIIFVLFLAWFLFIHWPDYEYRKSVVPGRKEKKKNS